MTRSLTFEKPITHKFGGTTLRDDYSVGAYQVRIDQLEPWEAIIDLIATIFKLFVIWLSPERPLHVSAPSLPKGAISWPFVLVWPKPNFRRLLFWRRMRPFPKIIFSQPMWAIPILAIWCAHWLVAISELVVPQ